MNLNMAPIAEDVSHHQLQLLFRVEQLLAPATTFAFIDVEPASICYTGFAVPSTDHESWWHVPGSLHTRGAILSFADGHSEFHRWHTPYNRPMSIQVPDDHPTAPGDRIDVAWLRRRAHHNVAR